MKALHGASEALAVGTVHKRSQFHAQVQVHTCSNPRAQKTMLPSHLVMLTCACYLISVVKGERCALWQDGLLTC